ncbi:hypothetical protein [Bacteroides ovatus]|uniref:hypothetical protein n=1 Tax=Bacteroides ovatus TaxID=28116 RepID=UPI0018CA10D2|nr:hypothetical protein [Bacteroides ovatus]MBG9219619.1 hypothetical protein [Bacteroides ovatus]MBG9232580.1 hypothetical protein [Bacteroides ovatus]
MKKGLFLMVAALAIMGCSKDSTFTDDSDDNKEIPEVSVTVDASDIKVVSATLTGNVNSNALEEDRLGVTNYGFIVSKSSNPTKENGWVLKGNNIKGNEFSVKAMNLAPTTQYYYVSFFYDGSKYYYGKILSFTTNDFNSTDLKAEANPGDTYVDFKGYLDYEKIGYFDSFKVAFCLNNAHTGYSTEMVSVGTHYTYETSFKSISAGTNHEYYFFIEYVDKSNIKHTFRGQNQSFYTPLELSTGAVDLGLSVLWAGVNLGASSPEQYGLFLAWGESTEKDNYTSSNYLYNGIIIGNDVTKPGFKIKTYDITNTDYDAPHKILSNGWHIPNPKQIKELIDNCNWKYMRYKGVDGFLVTGPNGNNIFIPAAGKYNNDKYEGERNYAHLWTGECIVDRDRRSSCVLNVSFYLASLNTTSGYVSSYYGHNIRPVKDKK